MVMKLEQIQLFVSGRVQGVGFRAAALRMAASLGLRGWVRNTEDSRVEIVAVGETGKIDQLLQWCGDGPRMARVDGVEIAGASAELNRPQHEPFEVRIVQWVLASFLFCARENGRLRLSTRGREPLGSLSSLSLGIPIPTRFSLSEFISSSTNSI